MKTLLLSITFSLPILLLGQKSDRFDYPDTLWVYGNSSDIEYGLSPEKPIKVGGGILPKNVYRYLNNLTDSLGNKVVYERIGSCCAKEINRNKPLTTFKVLKGGLSYQLYFDQYEWDQPKVLNTFNWKERRSGYHGEYKNDSIFHGYGLYFFSDGGYYKGQWENGELNGQGEMFIPDEEKYIGAFKDGRYHGFGTLFYPDGGKYKGQWVDGQKQGEGKIYYPPGAEIEFIEGIFENDAPIGTFRVVKSDGTEEKHEFNK